MQVRQTLRKSKNPLERAGSCPTHAFSLDLFLENGWEPSYSPFDPVEPDYRHQLLLKILPHVMEHELTELQYRCILMRYYGNYSVTEIANSLGVSPCTVTKHIQKALERLNQVLGYLFI